MNKASTVKFNPHRQYVIGTAGHIDHGKTALVKALTGIDTDRLPEEKARGITIDLGFAHLARNVTIIDVPGHERLIKNMVAGVSTIDLVLFTIAADDGVMPQTREHLDIVNLLQIQHGIFVITKVDLVDSEWLALVEEDVRVLLRNTPFKDSPILRTSTITGEGIEGLRYLLFDTLARIPPKRDFEIFRLPIDRVFTIKGFGTVVTGTVLSGHLEEGDRVEIQPLGEVARVRGLQTHDHDVKRVRVGYRAAVNLAGVDIERVSRGQVLVTPNFFKPVEVINARLTLLPSYPTILRNNQRIRFHIHTVETLARVIIPETREIKPGESAFVQMRLERPIHAGYRDRFIIRQYSPQLTMGGGVVLQTNPARLRRRHLQLFLHTLKRLEGSHPVELILASFSLLRAEPLTLPQLKVATNLPLNQLQDLTQALLKAGKLFHETIGGETYYFSQAQLQNVLSRIEGLLNHYHQQHPGRPGISEAEFYSRLENLFSQEALRQALSLGYRNKQIIKKEGFIRQQAFVPELSSRDAKLLREIEEAFRKAKFTPPTWKESLRRFQISQKELKEMLNLLRLNGKIVFVDENFLFHRSAVQEVLNILQSYFKTQQDITVGQFKDLLGVTRKHAIPLLEYFDREGITERVGDVRKAGTRLYKNTPQI